MAEKSTEPTGLKDDSFAIQTHQLTRTFNSLVAVDGLDLIVKKGELFALPLASLSGCWFSIDMMPSYLRSIAFAFPYAHSIIAARGVITRDVGLGGITTDFLFLVGWAAGIFAIGIILFRWNMRS